MKAGDKVSPERMDDSFLLAYARRMGEAKEHAGRVTPEYVLEHVQNMESLIREAHDQGFTVLAEFRQAVHQFQAELLMRTMQPDLIAEIPRESITDEDVRTFYEENIGMYGLPDIYAATVFHTLDEGEAGLLGAADGRAALDAEADVLPGVEVLTLDPMPLERFPGVWAQTLLSLETGECGPVVMHEDRFAVLCLEEARTNRTQDFEHRKEYIRNDVLYSRYRQAWREAYEHLREKHGVEIDPEAAERFRERMEEEREG
ncbi:peptidyl-prolyl cis-trans isomerase [Desulfonatronum sp. SC1]|uniref:peptidylprolyl isomerase n=1 Tax=Desulfonatronum sp. SC1 TaxID=2109626 RepID=UPI0013049F75|nr:peptidylprolyl isomerase [Desulfonatronum sp. SC1]